jgi:arsenate reductase (thioredoxin)
MKKKKVLILCTGNSCRSQMAEAVVNSRLTEGWEAYSAGTMPAGYVHPLALQVLTEIGIQHTGQSKTVDAVRQIDFDLVVTVCDSAAENCPLWLKGGQVVHLPFEDPAKVEGTQAQILEVFRRVRDEIIQQVPDLLQDFNKR